MGEKKSAEQSVKYHLVDILFIIFLVVSSLQFVQLSFLRISQVYTMVALLFFLTKKYRVADTRFLLIHCSFLLWALVVTLFAGYEKFKVFEQVIKFGVLYPASYLLGLVFARFFIKQNHFPIGWKFVVGFLCFQVLCQKLSLPIIFQDVSFQRDALHGTFRERNWLAFFFFFISSTVFLAGRRDGRDAVIFVGVILAVTLLSGSKVMMLCSMLIVFFAAKINWTLKPIAVGVGIIATVYIFSSQLDQSALEARLENERGASLTAAIELILAEPIGHGFGYVEYYFSSEFPYSIQGLGEGTNAVFSTPLDLIIIAGPVGFLYWAFIFCGARDGRGLTILSIAAWSLLNPLHQADLTYFALAFLSQFSAFGQSKMPPWRLRPSTKINSNQPAKEWRE
ncbi:hypothetical protein [Agrobacterium larrymoorei]|uniref:hypothetical protein n=1 Tax=Agrobacterium larrymoorei TaxID=160699 RepID=UPI0030BE5826